MQQRRVFHVDASPHYHKWAIVEVSDPLLPCIVGEIPREISDSNDAEIIGIQQAFKMQSPNEKMTIYTDSQTCITRLGNNVPKGISLEWIRGRINAAHPYTQPNTPRYTTPKPSTLRYSLADRLKEAGVTNVRNQ